MYSETKYVLDKNIRIRTPSGRKRIESIHRTMPLESLLVEVKFEDTDNVSRLKVSKRHTFMDIHGEGIMADDLKVGAKLLGDGIKGDVAVVTNIQFTGLMYLYDITLEGSMDDEYDQWYYSEGVVSHNSGKSITVASYLAWLFNFRKELNIGIAANRGTQAREFLHNVKNIFLRLPIWMTPGLVVWNKSSIESELGTRILTDVPSADSFRGFTISVLVVDECAFIRTPIWDEFADSIFASQSALSWKKNIIISTANGINHFHEIVQKSRNKVVDNSTLVEVKWDEVPRYDSAGDLIEPQKFRDGIIRRYGKVYFEQNYGNSFIGSSNTLVDGEVLNKLAASTPVEVWDEMLNIYEPPVPGNLYLIGVDSAKDGADKFCVQVLDVTEVPFRQVASASLDVDYLIMPEFLDEWGERYNNALMVIENNEGAGQSIADTLTSFYEYPNMYFETGAKRYAGFRTTVRSRATILKILKIFMESGQLIVRDKNTIDELLRFENVNGKFQASSGTDDSVMSLAVCFAPFVHYEKFEDFGKFIEVLKSGRKERTSSFITLNDMAFEDY